MIFRQLFERESCTYTYLLADGRGADAVIIDPVKGEVTAYRRLLEELELTLSYAIDTHIHADHVTALGDLRNALGCATVMGEPDPAPCVSRTVADGDVLQVGSISLTAMHTPGHTDNSYCFVMSDRVFTGDTLLIRGTGRTDFQNGDPAAAYDSLFHKVLLLPEATFVYPGHDYKGWTVSTIGEERRHNPRLQVTSAAQYVAIMNSLNLPHPRMMDVAIPANLACGSD